MPDWRDWLYESDPVWDYPELRGELSVPGFQQPWGIDPISGAPSPPTGGISSGRVDMSGGRSDIPQVVGKERTGRKTKLGSALLDILPRALEAGIAGAATPNIAGGGPTDFFRAAQAGAQALDKRDMNRLAMEQQYQQQAQQESLRRSQEQMYGAHADLYRAQAQDARTPKPGFLEKYNQLIASGMDAERAAIIASGGSLQHMKPAEPYKDMTRVDEGHPLASYGRPDGKGGYWVDNQIVATAMRPEAREQRGPAPDITEHTDKAGNVTKLIQDPSSPTGYKQVTFKGIGTPQREPAGEKPPKPPSPAQYLKVKQDRDKAIFKAEEEHRAALAKIQAGVNWTDPDDAAEAKAKERASLAALDRRKAQIVKEYREGIEILNADTEPQRGVPGARQPAVSPPKPPPSIPGMWRGAGLGRKKP